MTWRPMISGQLSLLTGEVAVGGFVAAMFLGGGARYIVACCITWVVAHLWTVDQCRWRQVAYEEFMGRMKVFGEQITENHK
jgi:hypothetical protein